MACGFVRGARLSLARFGYNLCVSWVRADRKTLHVVALLRVPFGQKANDQEYHAIVKNVKYQLAHPLFWSTATKGFWWAGGGFPVSKSWNLVN